MWAGRRVTSEAGAEVEWGGPASSGFRIWLVPFHLALTSVCLWFPQILIFFLVAMAPWSRSPPACPVSYLAE